MGVGIGIEAGLGHRSGRDLIDDDVMDDGSIRRPGLRRLDPDVFLELRRHADMNVLDRSLGGDGLRLWQFKNDVRSADRPPFRERSRRRKFRGIAEGGSLFEPGQERPTFGGGKTAVILEVAESGVGMPGGHSPFFDNLADHRGMLADIVIAQQGKWGDFAGPVAVLTLVLNDRRHVFGIGDLVDLLPFERVFLFPSLDNGRCRGADSRGASDVLACLFGIDSIEQTTDHGSRRDFHATAGEDLLDRILEVMMGGFRFPRSHPILVVNRPSIAHERQTVEHDHLAGSFREGLVGHDVPFVFEDGEVNLVLFRVRSDLSDGLMGV